MPINFYIALLSFCMFSVFASYNQEPILESEEDKLLLSIFKFIEGRDFSLSTVKEYARSNDLDYAQIINLYNKLLSQCENLLVPSRFEAIHRRTAHLLQVFNDQSQESVFNDFLQELQLYGRNNLSNIAQLNIEQCAEIEQQLEQFLKYMQRYDLLISILQDSDISTKKMFAMRAAGYVAVFACILKCFYSDAMGRYKLEYDSCVELRQQEIWLRLDRKCYNCPDTETSQLGYILDRKCRSCLEPVIPQLANDHCRVSVLPDYTNLKIFVSLCCMFCVIYYGFRLCAKLTSFHKISLDKFNRYCYEMLANQLEQVKSRKRQLYNY